MKRADQDRHYIRPILLVVAIAILMGVIIWHGISNQTEATQVAGKRSEALNTVVPIGSKKPTTLPSSKPTNQKKATKMPEPTKAADSNKTSAQPTATPIKSGANTVKPATVSLIAVGDDLVHTQVIRSGKKSDGTYNFDHLFKHLALDIKKADLAVINQETVLGGDSLGYSGYPRFNSPTEIGDAIRKAGFNVVLHATNHSMDKGEKGMQNTLNYWSKFPDITVLGAANTEEEAGDIPVVEVKGIKIAMLNYTYGLNGLPLPSKRKYMVSLLEEGKIRSDVAKAKIEADFVIVFPHWGNEYVYTPSKDQEKWTTLFLELGVDLVIGAHPHVLEPVEWLERADGHKMLVYYSLGNYVSGQTEVPRMLGGMASVTIERTAMGEVGIKEATVTPIVTHYTSSYKNYSVYKLSEYTSELASKHGLKRKGLSVKELNRLSEQILGDWYKD